AQTAKMIVLSRGWSEYKPSTPSFADVPANSPLYGFVEESARRGIISGYPCGGPGEPCTGGNYFRPNRDVTRGQISKMLSQAIGAFTGASPASDK
ncbi:MAG TPA: S-layer homology domain-containing protein, partial [Chloroflexia bacterium]